jgi:hypothetical protein
LTHDVEFLARPEQLPPQQELYIYLLELCTGRNDRWLSLRRIRSRLLASQSRGRADRRRNRQKPIVHHNTRARSKQAAVLALLSRPRGATIAAMMQRGACAEVDGHLKSAHRVVEAVARQFLEAARAERVLDERENLRHVADEVAHAAELVIVAGRKKVGAVRVQKSLHAGVLTLPPRSVFRALEQV